MPSSYAALPRALLRHSTAHASGLWRHRHPCRSGKTVAYVAQRRKSPEIRLIPCNTVFHGMLHGVSYRLHSVAWPLRSVSRAVFKYRIRLPTRLPQRAGNALKTRLGADFVLVAARRAADADPADDIVAGFDRQSDP
jgi:hypothetical protein